MKWIATVFAWFSVMLQDANVTDVKTLLFSILLIIAPAFTLFALFAPRTG